MEEDTADAPRERTDSDRLASVFNQMRQRCNNPNSEKYPIYGGRGIEVRFASGPEFRDWALANGYRKGLTIDRIDNDGHYEPGNCRWVDRKAQVRNRRVTVTLTAFGETKPIADWVEDPRCTVTYEALVQRARKCKRWTSEQMVTLPEQLNQQQGPGRAPAPTHCPDGHDYAVTKVMNQRGDYYCSECSRVKNRARYLANREGKSA